MPTWVWILIAIFAIVVIALLVIRSMVNRRVRAAEDQAVLDDFRNWAGYGGLGQKEDPVCSNCGTVYNRAVVISLIKQQSPEIFDFQMWTTKFVCKKCREHIVISGLRGE